MLIAEQTYIHYAVISCILCRLHDNKVLWEISEPKWHELRRKLRKLCKKGFHRLYTFSDIINAGRSRWLNGWGI
jgi:hypothetical protein